MDMVQARIDIVNWITGFVEQPHPALNGWQPCPFARKARLDSQFDIRAGSIDPYSDLMKVEMDDWMVLAYVYDPRTVDAERFARQIDCVNQGFLIHRNIVALADHPDSPEEVLGVRMNQGIYAIAFVQPLDKLNQFARQIAAKGYYTGWPEDYLQDLFRFREDPRQ